MKKKMFIWMAAACAALFAIFAACESDNKDDDSSDGQKVDPSLVGYWENLSLDPDLSVLTKIHINGDGTGEVYYILPNDSEHHYFYAAEFSFDGDKCSISIKGLNKDDAVNTTYSLDGQGNLCLALSENQVLIFAKTDEGWGNHYITNIFAGNWESDDNYDKIYLNVEKYDFLSCESVGVYVDKDKNEYAINIYQSGAATRAYHILTDRDRMTLSRPEFDGDCLKVKIEGVNRSLKPMAKWPYKTYDQLQ